MRDPNVATLIRIALREDLGRAGDLTTKFFVPRASTLAGGIVAKKPGVVCGLDVAAQVFRAVSGAIRYRPLARDGQRVRARQVVAWVEGPPAVLTAERTALNFIQRLSGIATLTRAFVDQVRGTRTRVLDTRKTIPGYRALDKYAVRCGGGGNHRMGLYDMVMLKDNHLAAHAEFERSMQRFRREQPEVPVLMEAKDVAEVDLALRFEADIILLDNMAPAELKIAIQRVRRRSPKTQIEISGGVRLDNVRELAKLGPDRISVGALTHSAPALDFSLEIGIKPPKGI